MARGILAYFGFRSKPEAQEASSTQPTSPKQQGMKRRRSVLTEIQPDSLPQRAVVSSEQPSTVKTFQYVEGLFICCDPTSVVRQVLKVILQYRSERSTRTYRTLSATKLPLFLTSPSTTRISPSSAKPPHPLNPFAQLKLRKTMSNRGLAHSPKANG